MIDTPPAIVIQHDAGGMLGEYLERAARYRNGWMRVEIRGECDSSCTVLLSVPDVCVGDGAVLGFHAPTQNIGPRTGASYFAAVMMSYYPKPVRDWVVNNGGLTEKIIYLHGPELQAMFPRCR